MTNKIAINGRFMSRRITGVDRVAREISRRLANSRVIQPINNVGLIAGNLWEQFLLPAKIRQNEILWSPANAGPWIVKNQVLTLHDASVFDHPKWFKPSFAAWARISWKVLAKRVKAIVTVSKFSRERLSLHLGIPAEKIHVAYNGVGKPFEPQTAGQTNLIKKKYNIKKPYFLFVGTIEPRKNLKALLTAWDKVNSKSHELFLAGTGGAIFSYTDHARNAVHVIDADLPALYSGAAAYINPSLYEGFGLTILEAMACGTPVIASSIDAFSEVFQDSIISVDPKNPTEILNAIQKVIDNPSLADTYRQRGLKLAHEYTWDKSAEKLQSLLRVIQ